MHAPRWYLSRTYRGSSLIRNCLLLGPYSRPMPRTLRWLGRGVVLCTRYPCSEATPPGCPIESCRAAGAGPVGLIVFRMSEVQGYLAHTKQSPLGTYSRTMPRALWYTVVLGGWAVFLMSEVPLYEMCRRLEGAPAQVERGPGSTTGVPRS